LKKKLLIVFGIIVLIGIAGGVGLNYNWYKIPGILNGIKNLFAKNQSVAWQEGIATQTADKPNIIVIMIDNLGFNEVNTYWGGLANGKLKNPNIDQLAAPLFITLPNQIMVFSLMAILLVGFVNICQLSVCQVSMRSSEYEALVQLIFQQQLRYW
jgi:hypothetical protein